MHRHREQINSFLCVASQSKTEGNKCNFGKRDRQLGTDPPSNEFQLRELKSSLGSAAMQIISTYGIAMHKQAACM